MGLISLRPYQTTALDAVRLSYRQGKRAPILVSPTGSGKTVMASSIIDGAVAKGKRVLFLAHRFELVAQTSMKLASYGIEHKIIARSASVRQIIVQQFKALGKSYIKQDSLVSVGTVQSQSRRLEDVIEPPDLIIIDECHLSIAPSYLKCINAFPKALVLGLTASPTRLDGKGLGKNSGGAYDELIVLCQPKSLVDQGFLVPMRFFAAPQQIDVSNVRTVAGDYDPKQIAEIVDTPMLIGNAVEHYKKVAHGRPAIAFCASIKHAQDVAEQFCAAGYRAVAVSGETESLEREHAIAGLGNGTIDVVCNCALYIEGLDQTAISCILQLTPTQSLTRYMQGVGRGSRPHDGKTDCIVLDHAGNIFRHGHPYDDREWTLDEKPKKRTSKPKDQETSIQTCSQCFAIHEPARVCPVCGFEHPIKERKLEQQEGDLVEIDDAALEVMRRQKRVMQGRAQTVEDLMRQGIGRVRAIKILQARNARQLLVDEVVNKLTTTKEKTGMGPYQACGYTFAQIRMCKPKELKTILALLG